MIWLHYVIIVVYFILFLTFYLLSSLNYIFRVVNIPRNKDYKITLATQFDLEVWYHVLLTYKHARGLDVYLNGCHSGTITDAQAIAYIAPAPNITPLSITFSCQNRTTGLKVCSRDIIDEFYMWKDQKPPIFAYQMYHMYA